jgi:hypothetical protein
MMRGFSRRGQPLLVLVMVLGGWVSARAMMWDASTLPAAPMPASKPLAVLAKPAKAAPISRPAAAYGTADWVEPTVLPESPGLGLDAPVVASAPAELAPAPMAPSNDLSPAYREEIPRYAPLQSAASMAPPREPYQPAAPAPAAGRVAPRIAGGHQMMWMAALSQMPMPPEMLGARAPMSRPEPFYPGSPEPRLSGQTQRISRWSADGWVLWRRGSKLAPSGGLLTPSYGASQLGAVLRYRLAPDSALRPAAYLRATAALNGTGEREAALGLSLRPISRLPLSLQGEARFTSTPGGHLVRPAVLAVTELPLFALPLGLRGEAYGQAGYVGGRFATGFADGQLRVDRRVVQIGRADLRLGGGVWGGIQKGASRLDAGPSLSVGQPLGGPASLRLAADWRFRLAGKAAPASGPAVTLSAGF